MTTPPAEGPTPDQRAWLSVGQASRILGVDESTLRRWADAGHVHSYRTPGGHRRFAEADLRALLSSEGLRSSLQRHGELSSVALTRIRRRLHRPRVDERPWLTLRNETRDRLRVLGRRLVSLAFEYLGRRTRRSALLTEARQIGRDYGQELVDSGLHLPEAFEAFTFFRKSLDETTRRASQDSGLSAEETLTACTEIMVLADEVLLGVAGAFDQSTRGNGAGDRRRRVASQAAGHSAGRRR